MKRKRSFFICCMILLSALMGFTIATLMYLKKENKKYEDMKKMSEKHLCLFVLMTKWMKAKQHGKNIDLYLREHGYSKIAVYGMSYVGERLIDDLKQTDIKVEYGIDQRGVGYSNIKVYTLSDSFPETDAIIVTPIFFFDEIKCQLKEKTSIQIISLEDIVDDLLMD